MKIKDLFKKIEGANELNEFAGLAKLCVELGYDNRNFNVFNTYKEFKKFVCEEYVLADKLLESDFEIGKEFNVSGTIYGSELNSNFQIDVYSQR